MITHQYHPTGPTIQQYHPTGPFISIEIIQGSATCIGYQDEHVELTATSDLGKPCDRPKQEIIGSPITMGIRINLDITHG